MQSVSNTRWAGGALPAPSATVEWTVPKLLESLHLQHHEALFEGMSFAELKKKDVKSIPGLPLGPAIKISRKLADIKEASQDVQLFRLAGYQLGKTSAPEAEVSGAAVARTAEEASFKPGVALTLRRRPKAAPEPPVAVDESMIYADGDMRKMQEQLGGRRQRRPTITLAPKVLLEKKKYFLFLFHFFFCLSPHFKEASDLQQMLEEQHEEGASSGRVVSSAPNFFDLFGLNLSPPNKPLPQPPAGDDENEDDEATTAEGIQSNKYFFRWLKKNGSVLVRNQGRFEHAIES